ncbi:MAG TPA: hypothetical protein VFA83_00575 [Acidimicrobiales bacterium]|nr:hypothetical protein [Acidimicrobiales bacterium]
MITSTGPLTKIAVSSDLTCAVNRAGDSHGEFYNDAACGTFVAVGSTVYGPATIPAGPKDPGTSGYKKFTPVSQTVVSGAGTAASPYQVVTRVNAGSTGIQVTQTDSYVTGQESYRTDVAVTNVGLSSANVVLYRAGDCYLQDSDLGFGAADAASGSVSCVGATLQGSSRVPNSRIEQWYPLTGGSHYVHDNYAQVWSKVLSRAPLPNACNFCSTYQDNGAGLSWSFTLPAGQSTTRSQLLTFSPVGTSPMPATVTADAASVAPGAATGYAITIANPNNVGITLTSIFDDLPVGFTYRSGTTSGALTADPAATNNGSHLQWTTNAVVPANGQIQVHFGVTAPTTAGDFYDTAGGTAAGSATVAPSGNTAKVTVLGPASLTIGADRGSVAANPSSVPLSTIPLQRTSPAVQSAPIPLLPILGAPIPLLPILGAPIFQLPLLGAPIPLLPILSAPIPLLPILSAAIGFDVLNNPADIGGAPAVKAGLARVSLSSLRITSGDDWPARIANTALAGRQLESLTFGDALANVPSDKLPTLGQMDLSGSPLGHISTLSLLMGDTRLTGIGGVDWCTELQNQGHADCGVDLGVPGSADKGKSATLLGLEVAGVNVDGIAGLKQVTMRQVQFPPAGQSALPAISLTSFDLFSSSIGGILLTAIANPSSVVDCTKVSCAAGSTANLWNASQAGAIRTNATIASLGDAAGGLTLQEAALGTYPQNNTNSYDIPADKLGVLGYGGAGASEVKYHVAFSDPYPLSHPVVAITLPPEFRYESGSAAVSVNGAPMTNPPAPSANNESVTFDFANFTLPAGQPMTVDFAARPGLQLGLMNATVVLTGDNFTLNAGTAAPVQVTETNENGDSAAQATAIQPGSMVFGYMSHAGDVDTYTFPAPAPGSEIDAYLTCANCDADLTLFHPASAKAHNPLRAAAPLPAVRAEQDQPLGLTNLGEPLVPGTLDDMPLADLPVAGISANRGTEAESVRALSWDAAPGSLYTIQVASYNGSTSPNAYGLHVSVTPPVSLPAGNARVFPHDADATRDTPSIGAVDGVQTLVIADRERLRRAYGDTRAQVALDALDRLAATPGLGVRTLFVDAYSDVQSAFAALDAKPSDPERSNDVVRAINTHVDSLLGANRAALQNVVLVGTDEVLPMARVPDLTSTSNERTFSQELGPLASSTGGNDALLGAAAAGMIMTDDPYGAFSPRPFLGTFLYIPDVGLGRLVESPEDIAAVVNQFLTPTQAGDAPGILRPATSLVTGYDFMTPLANALKATLSQSVTPNQVSTLIGAGWNKNDLTAAFPGAHPVPDVVAPNGHYSPDAMEPADPSAGLLTTTAFGGSTPADVAKRIIFQMGCHSGFSISNFLASGGSAPDWPETFMGRGVAAFVGNTGFGIGIDSVVAFSERVMSGFAANISQLPLGRALSQAKQDYLGGGQPNVYDYKVMAEATYFGLPMFRLPGANGVPAPPAPRPTFSDQTTGLRAADIQASNPDDGRWQLNVTNHGQYYTLRPDLQTAVAPNRPIQPKVTLDVTEPGARAAGVQLTGLQSLDQQNFDPALARVVVATAANEGESQFADVIYPTTLAGITSTSTPAGSRDQAVLIPAQFQANPGSATMVGRERRFTNITGRVFYAPAGSTDTTPPLFHTVSATKNGSVASYRVTVDDLGGGTVGDVTLLYHDGTNATWQFRHLAKAADGSWVGGFPIGSGQVEYLVQAVDSSGNVASTTNKGDLFDSVPPVTGSPDIHAAVNATDGNGWYPNNTTITLDGPSGTTFAVADNGGAATTYNSGQAIPVTGGGVHTLHYVANPSGASGDVTVPVDVNPPTISSGADRPANGNGWYNAPVTVHFTCADGESGVAVCEPDHAVSTDGANQSVTGTARDYVGNTRTSTVSGINIDSVPPTISGATTTQPNGGGWYNHSVTVHFTCDDDRSGIDTCPADQTLTVDGRNQSVTGTAVDKAGNATSFTVSGINIDTSPPAVSVAPDRAANAYGWYGAPVTFHFTCTDGGSGLSLCPADQTLSGDGGNQSVSGTATDAAGNTATVAVSGINIDRTLPTISGAPDRAPNANGWYNAAVTVRWTCGDALSGVASCTSPFTLSSEGANQSVNGLAVDKAANSAIGSVTGLNIDATGPSSAFAGSGLIVVAPGGSVNGSAADNLSGISAVNVTFVNALTGLSQSKQATLTCNGARTSCTWTVVAPTVVGLYHASSVATDRAGNAQTAATQRDVQVVS